LVGVLERQQRCYFPSKAMSSVIWEMLCRIDIEAFFASATEQKSNHHTHEGTKERSVADDIPARLGASLH